MGAGYQERDYEIIDYELYRLDDLRMDLRGPRPARLEDGAYFACIGAAQTFGCFAEEPFPTSLKRKLELEVLNVGRAGAGPLFFLRKGPVLLRYLNQARFAIVQVMSARSEDNRLFNSGGLEYLRRRSDGQLLGAEPAYREVLESQGSEYLKALIAETRENWVSHFRELLQAVTVPKILFWFSRRRPDGYREDYSTIGGVFGPFPHLVTPEMVDQIKQDCDEYVECVTSRGLPQKLISRFTGEPTTIRGRPDLGGRVQTVNTYYPSPEMHVDATAALWPVCERYVTPISPQQT